MVPAVVLAASFWILLLWAVSAIQQDSPGSSSKQRRLRPTSRSWLLKSPQLLLLLVICIPSLVKAFVPSTVEEQNGETKIPCSPQQSNGAFVGFPTTTATAAYSLPVIAANPSPKVGIFPPFLEWGEKPLFSPSPLTLTIANLCNTSLLTVFPPFSTNLQFYVAGFREAAVVPPGEKFSMRVVFLPKIRGKIEGVLILQTSFGGFLVQVEGKGRPSPYDINVASGNGLRKSVSLRNPHEGVVKVTEVRLWPADSENHTLVLINPLNDDAGLRKCCSSGSNCGCALDDPGDDDDDGLSYYVSLMRPGSSWEIDSGQSLQVLEMEFRASAAEFSWNGFIYIGLSSASSSSDGSLVSDQLVIPIQVQKDDDDLPDLQAVPEVIDFGVVSSRKEVKKQAIHIRNSGDEVVQILQMSHSFGGRRNLVVVRYKQGLVVRPGTQVQVAVAWFRGIHESLSLQNHHSGRKIDNKNNLEMIFFHTNSSRSRLLQVPYQAFVLHSGFSEEGFEEEERVDFLGTGLQLKLSFFEKLETEFLSRDELESGFRASGELELVEEDGDEEARLTLQPSKQSLFLLKSGLRFSPVQVGSSGSLWLTVINPADTPVSVNLFLSHEAEAFSCRFSSEDASEAPNDPAVFSLPEGGGISELVLGSQEEGILGPVLFRPSKRCSWKSLLALKNNLTVLEWMPLQGIGSTAEISLLDDANSGLPLESLRLGAASTGDLELVSTVTAGVDENLSRLSERLSSRSCDQLINGSLVAKNTGDVPLKVHSMGLTNGECSWKGLELLSCEEDFWLAAGETTELRVTYKPDYFSAQVKHGLQLVTSVGIVNLPVLVVLPDHMIRLCARLPIYSKYKKVVMCVGFITLCLFVLLISSSSKRLKDMGDCNARGSTMTSSLPFFREETFAPLMTEDHSSSGLSKLRVKVAGEESCVSNQDTHDHQSGGVAASSGGGGGTDEFKQQHSIAVSSPVSSPRKASKSQIEKNKRKRKKSHVSLVKHQEASATSSPCSSNPGSPASTSVSSERPVSPLFAREESSRAAAAVVKVTPMLPSSSSSSSQSTGSHWIPKQEARSNKGGQQKTVQKTKYESVGGEWVTVGRKSAAVYDGKTPKKVSPTLKQSASFPNRTHHHQHHQQHHQQEQHHQQLLLQSQICPSARAPGSKITKTDSSSSLQLINEDNCSSGSSSNRFSEGEIPQGEFSSSSSAAELVYDIWGDHFGEFSRQTKKIGSGGEETQSLFAYSVLKREEDGLPQQEEEAVLVDSSSPSSEFSMFSGNAAAAFFNNKAAGDEQQHEAMQQNQSSYFLLSPFDLSYSKRMQFAQAPSV